jgi:hypothetical protein
LGSHKEGTKTNRWKHQHPKQTYCRNSMCVGKSPINYIQELYQTIPTRIREVIRMNSHLTKYYGRILF